MQRICFHFLNLRLNYLNFHYCLLSLSFLSYWILSLLLPNPIPNSILSFLELSRKLKTEGPDADLVQVASKAVEALDDDADGMALDALPELIDQVIDHQAAEPLPLEQSTAIASELQHELGIRLMTALGFDRNRGRIDRTRLEGPGDHLAAVHSRRGGRLRR